MAERSSRESRSRSHDPSQRASRWHNPAFTQGRARTMRLRRRLTATLVATLMAATTALVAQQLQYPDDEEGRPRRHLSRRRRSPIRIAGSRTTTRRRPRRGSRPEQGHVRRTSTKIPYRERSCKTRVHAAQQLREVLGARRARAPYFFFTQERRPAEPERALHPEGARRHARGADRSEHVVGRRHRRGWRRSRRRRTRSTPSTACRAAAPTGRNTR